MRSWEEGCLELVLCMGAWVLLQMAATWVGIGRLLGEGKARGWQEGGRAGQRAAMELLMAVDPTADGSEGKGERESG